MPTPRHALAAWASLLALVPAAAAAPPALTWLYPAGVQQGKSAEITAAGTFDPWPVQAWTDARGVTLQPAREKGRFTLTASADAVPGLHWLRLVNAEGASVPRPFLVGTLPEVAEQEPNDEPRKPQAVAAGVTVNGRLEKSGDVDGFAVTLRKGQTLVAALDANRALGSPMDAVLQLASVDGFVLDQDHDSRDLDPQLVYTAPADGTYVVRVFAFPATPDSGIRFAGGDAYIYRLTLTTGGFADHALPLAVSRASPGPVAPQGWNIPAAAQKLPVAATDDDEATVAHPQLASTVRVRLEPHAVAVEQEPNPREQPQPLTPPVTLTGRIDPPGDVDMYRFTAPKGQKLLFQVEARSLGAPLDAVLRLTDAAGKQLARVDDPGGRRDSNRDPEMPFTAPADGTYLLEVRDLHGGGGFRYVYRLRAVVAQPDYELTLAADRFVMTPGKPLDLAVTVVAREGFRQEVELRAEGLPEGMTAAPVKAAAGAKTATLQLTATKGPVSGPVRVVGQAAGMPALRRVARAPVPGFPATTDQPWLTVVKPGTEPVKPTVEKKKKK